MADPRKKHYRKLTITIDVLSDVKPPSDHEITLIATTASLAMSEAAKKNGLSLDNLKVDSPDWKILTLKKYAASTFRGEKIIHIEVNPSGEFRVDTHTESKVFYLGDDVQLDNADYIICQIQDEPEIKVRKY